MDIEKEKNRLAKDISRALHVFYERTGRYPSSLYVDMVEVTESASPHKEFMPGLIDIEIEEDAP